MENVSIQDNDFTSICSLAQVLQLYVVCFFKIFQSLTELINVELKTIR